MATVRSRLLPDVKDETGTLHRALELSALDLDPIVLHIDPATHLIAKQIYVAGGPGQPLVEELFSDYRPVDGVQIAFLAKVRRGGRSSSSAGSPASRSTRHSIPHCSNAPPLEPAHPAVVRRAVRRFVRGRADARAALARSGNRGRGSRRARVCRRRGRAHRRLSRSGGDRSHRGVAKLPQSFRLLRTLVRWARDERPDALVVIDFPDFNFPLARAHAEARDSAWSTTSARRSGPGVRVG